VIACSGQKSTPIFINVSLFTSHFITFSVSHHFLQSITGRETDAMDDKGLPETLPGFDQPLALLRACHTKILAHCDLLEQLVAILGNAGKEEETRGAARQVMTYFSTSARLHHQDEEIDLFPLLTRQSLKMADLVHGLKQEHRELDVLWETLAADLKRLPDVTDHAALAARVHAFCELNRRHARRENMEFLPRAESSLSGRQLKDIGAAMAARRGVRHTG
jgi:hemerythrin-like domain-containing protein